jgi:hypothetical protein
MSNGTAVTRAGGGALVVASVAFVVATVLAGNTWERTKTRPKGRTIEVTGSAKKRIVSDQIEWSASLQTQNMDRTAAYRTLAGHVRTALAYLTEQGMKNEEIRVASASVQEVHQAEFTGSGENRVERDIFKGYSTSQTITVRSGDVTRVERISREITQLLERGVPIASSRPLYFYTKLGELKIEMLAAAAKDARVRANSMLEQTGGAKLGKLRFADMGVINVNPANSTETSWEGRSDTSSLDKDILTVVHVTFDLD